MLKQPHLDVKKIKIQTVKDNSDINTANQRFNINNNSKYENSTDPCDFKSDTSVSTKNSSNLDQVPKFLLKQINDTRGTRQSKNSGMSKYEIVSSLNRNPNKRE